MPKIHKSDGVNLLIRTLFSEWSSENLAQIYTSDISGIGDFCKGYFKIGVQERQLGRLFYILKKRAWSIIEGYSSSLLKEENIKSKSWSKLPGKIISYIIDQGYWDLIFRIRLSNSLCNFIKSFKPDIIYTQGYSLSFSQLALEISKRFGIPIFYFPMDDWHSYLYSRSFVHSKVCKIAEQLAIKSKWRFALGPKMAEVFSKRYNVNFECLYHADDPSRFIDNFEERKKQKEFYVIGYIGSLYLKRYEAFIDLEKACILTGIPFRIDIYCERIPFEVPEELLNSNNVRFYPLPKHEEVPTILSNCDVLFLPESFDKSVKEAIELSLSTKAHLYMFSRKPIIIYAPPWSGTLDYAKRYKWAIVVDNKDLNKLAKALEMAFENNSADYIDRAYKVALNNHDIYKIRKMITHLLFKGNQ